MSAALPGVMLAACRLRLWFENPNMAAVLLAELALVAAALFAARRRAVRIAAVGGFLVSVAALVFTGSRGGLVSLAAGAVAIAAFSRVRRRRHAALGLVVAALVAALVALPRFHGLASDRSVLNRLDIWRKVPQMMRDAPNGWGRGNSGLAYMNWYQSVDRCERYRTLVNGHLTALAEHGRCWRVCYLAGIFAALGMGVLAAARTGRALPLALWLALVVSAAFSTTTERWELWVLPMASAFGWAGTAVRCPRRTLTVVLLAMNLALVGLWAAMVFFTSDEREDWNVRVPREGVVVYGCGGPTRWLVADSAALGGTDYPRAFRRAFPGRGAYLGAWGIVERLEDVPDGAAMLVLAGTNAVAAAEGDALARFAQLADLRLVSPSFDVTKRPVRLREGVKVRTLYGEFAPECPVSDAPGVDIACGAGRYVPGWAKFVFEK